MKNLARKFSIFLFLLIFFLATFAYADKGVFNVTSEPNETYINTPTTITIIAEIGSEDLYISSVAAYKTTESGKPIVRLGQMYDDGTHGDAIEADTIFTMQFEVNEPVDQKIYAMVTAAYSRDRRRYLSQVSNSRLELECPKIAT